MRKIIISFFIVIISGCQSLPEPKCIGVALIGGQEVEVKIYDERSIVQQKEYRAGYPFNWKWVNSSNFIRTTCNN